ncbi:hypothetical protein CFP56_034235 [Quercus suber]|uniref:Uncharacterized protein n=1 Tax=Quercus suber TaxID=58331 RepID=A0AAW0JCR7_QUESU
MEKEENLGHELEIRERELEVQPWRLNLGLAIEQEKETELPQVVARGGNLWWHQVGTGHFEREKMIEDAILEGGNQFEKVHGVSIFQYIYGYGSIFQQNA